MDSHFRGNGTSQGFFRGLKYIIPTTGRICFYRDNHLILCALLETKTVFLLLNNAVEVRNGEKIAHFFGTNQDLISRI
jgi:hypothetical protein